jgi:hypothetical protein
MLRHNLGRDRMPAPAVRTDWSAAALVVLVLWAATRLFVPEDITERARQDIDAVGPGIHPESEMFSFSFLGG